MGPTPRPPFVSDGTPHMGLPYHRCDKVGNATLEFPKGVPTDCDSEAAFLSVYYVSSLPRTRTRTRSLHTNLRLHPENRVGSHAEW